ncbi:MAG: hypothetical protein A2046_00335 [Bacteroidetes bacterium GWA2_30_7]|nr:MAG: hypothetical protein A2046_00335 [Bacteroidetes bacterium GWA2_30_7]
MYNQGDIVVIKFPFSDLSEVKKRPALIISNDAVNKTGDYLMVQITSKVKNDGLSFKLSKENYVNNKYLPLESYIRLYKIFLLNSNLILYKATSINNVCFKEITKKIIELIN